MEDVAAGQLLWSSALDLDDVVWVPGVHLLAAYDARVFPGEVLLGGVWIHVEIPDGLAVAEQGRDALDERPYRHEEVPHDVDREGRYLADDDNGEEAGVENKL